MKDDQKSQRELIKELNYREQQNKQMKVRIEALEKFSELNQTFNTMGNGIRLIDKDRNILKANDAFCKMAGLTVEEIISKKCYEVFKSSFCLTPDCALEEIVNGKKVIDFEVDKQKSDGSLVSCLLTVQPLYNKDDEVIAVIEDFRDVTSLKLSEQALRESEAKFRSYIDKAPDGIFIVDSKGRYVDVNPAACESLGYTKEEFLKMKTEDVSAGSSTHFEQLLRDSDLVLLYEVESEENFRVRKVNEKCLKIIGRREEEVVGKLIQEIMPPEVAAKLIENDRQAVIEGTPIQREDIFNFGHFQTNFIPVLDEEGKCKFLVVTASDISEKKKMEEHMLKIEKLETVGSLAGGIAHDFNNILTVITGNISLAKIKIENLEGEQKKDIITILSEVEKASLQARKLTQQLLTFAKGDSPILKTASIDELIKESVSFALRGSNVKCQFSIPKDLWLVEIDEGQINQVIHNLVINADQAMPNGGTIKVLCDNYMIDKNVTIPIDDGEYVKVTIKDNGIGIPTNHLNNIFDPYFTTKLKGSGLGLTTVYSIIRKHGGCILVESEPGSGTTFEVYLRASRAKKLKRVKQEFDVSIVATGKILVMDDQEMLLKVLSEMLNHIGYEVACAKDGVEAINLYKYAKESHDPFDAIIMDLTIPGGMGGRETIKELLKYDPEVKTIVSSGYSEDQVMAKYKRHGFKAVLSKPFSLVELNQVMREVLNH